MSGPNPDSGPSLSWDEKLMSLESEAVTYEETPESMSRKVFKRNLLSATLSIVELARGAANERIRLQAAQYIVERNLGRIQDSPPSHADDPLHEVMSEFVSQIPDNLGN